VVLDFTNEKIIRPHAINIEVPIRFIRAGSVVSKHEIKIDATASEVYQT
jgi:hypothetical protein